MNLKTSTILITGGTSGIGFEIAKQLLEKGATVIVTGRDQEKLNETKRLLPRVETIQSDAGDAKQIEALRKTIEAKFPKTNIVINNAGIMRKLSLHDKRELENVTKEIEINLMGPIRMIQEFLPLLKSQSSAAIVNVSSGLAFVPFAMSPVYSATKAGLHSFTQALRIQLKSTSVKVFELAPPGTETPLFRGKEFSDKDLGGMKGMDVKVLAKAAIAGLESDTLEIRPGLSNTLKWMGRIAPNFAANMLGKSAEAMVAAAKTPPQH
jgi:uncharacterized oxidoreductase